MHMQYVTTSVASTMCVSFTNVCVTEILFYTQDVGIDRDSTLDLKEVKHSV